MSHPQKQPNNPDTLLIRQMIESGGAQYVGDYKPMQSGNSFGGRCPQPFADMFDLNEDDVELEVYVDTNSGFFGFRVADHDGGDLDEYLE